MWKRNGWRESEMQTRRTNQSDTRCRQRYQHITLQKIDIDSNVYKLMTAHNTVFDWTDKGLYMWRADITGKVVSPMKLSLSIHPVKIISPV
jgi:hypothetical protein